MEADVNAFVDAKGRTWRPKINGLVLARYEQRTDVGVFSVIFDLMRMLGETPDGLPEVDGETDGEKTIRESENTKRTNLRVWKLIDGVGRKLCGNIEDLFFLLYESCRPAIVAGQPELMPVQADGQEVSFEDFCAAIESDQLKPALSSATVALVDYFPQVSEAAGVESGEGSDPLHQLLGRMSTKLQGSPE